jgi:hypothetical protein
MSQLQNIVEDNRKERKRLSALVAGLKEADFAKRLPNGWTVGQALAHLAFWDLRQAMMLKRWLEQGEKPATIASMDPDAVNGPLAILSASLPAKEVVKLTTAAAEAIDQLVEKLTSAQCGELIGMGLERNIYRALHRRNHLDKIESVLKGSWFCLDL